ncbi:SDR family oxidoreductase [Nocardia ninae]|uniref:Oxidoreductase n=1 Tax=Nocardia ninae NBRC 108245 TaxID=1210091 RepID=A0A511MGN8_9NOCA|nr:SDR family oxidoreductase [Nocardia ninae]GEM39840.1 oxidoreductase [Nocardia ninae NBRC 108245]
MRLGLRWPTAGFEVCDRAVVITGAGQGIGLELARMLHRRGASVAMIDLDEARTRRAEAELGERALAVHADVADRDGMVAALATIRERFGRIDVVVANAGVTPTPATIRTMDPDDFDRVLAINLTGVFNTVRPALDDIVAARGHVVVVSSCAAFAPGMGGSPYMISKAGVEQFGRALRVELALAGASAGVAYFGIVETAMTKHTLDEDELGRAAGQLLPWPLNRRITAADAAASIADGIAHRAARTIAPSVWEPYALLRGAVNVALDRYLSLDPRTHDLIRRLEQRVSPHTAEPSTAS